MGAVCLAREPAQAGQHHRGVGTFPSLHWPLKNHPVTCCYRLPELHSHHPSSAASQASLTRGCQHLCCLSGRDEGLKDPCAELGAHLSAAGRRRLVCEGASSSVPQKPSRL